MLREPLFHFFIVGLFIFAAYYLVRGNNQPAADIITVTPERISQLGAGFSAVWKRKPSDKELKKLIEDYVREEVYYRDALALGLDSNDTIVRRRLRQKMEFLANSGAYLLKPEQEELESFYKTNSKLYRREPRIAFEQIFLGSNPSTTDIDRWLNSLHSGQTSESGSIGQSTLLPAQLSLSPRVAIDGVFGKEFFDQLLNLPVNSWSGPVKSSYGTHLVRLKKRTKAEQPELEKIRSTVLRDWKREKETELRNMDYEKRRAKYVLDIQQNKPGS